MGDVIAGRFELREPIARGATGTVWHAWDHKHARPCAAKVLRQRDSADLLRFVREQSITATHRHLLTPYGWAAEDAHVVIAMPLAAGGTVADALDDFGGLGQTPVAQILHQVLDGLAALHEAGWVHRDIKPENLMFAGATTDRPQVLVADFGIALHRDDVRFTRTGMVHGTAGFLAPEALRGETVNPAQDIYAAGITALRMLGADLANPTNTTEPADPTATADPTDTADTADLAPGAISGLDPQLASLLAAMVATDPEQRPTAREAQAQIIGIPGLLEGPMVTATGEPFEVFDHLAIADTGPAHTGSNHPLPPPRPPTTPQDPNPTKTAPAQSPSPRPAGWSAGHQSAGHRSAGHRDAAKARRRRTRGVITAALSVVALVAGVVLIVNAFGSTGGPRDRAPTPPPAGPVEERDPDIDGDDRGTSGQDDEPDGGQEPTDEPDHGQEPADDPPDQPDRPCTWVQENTTIETAHGDVFTCLRHDDGSYAWQ